MCENLTSLDLTGLNTENVAYMRQMFYGCNHLKTLDVTGFNTSSVVDMSEMFSGCDALTSLDVSGFDTSNVEYKTDRTRIGKHTFVVKFIGFYAGNKDYKGSFTIIPAKAGIASTKAGKKSLTVKAKAQKGGVKYQIAVKLKTEKKWKTYTITKPAKTIKGLKSKKQYQVRIRAFKKADGKNWYGAWSKVKTIKVK